MSVQDIVDVVGNTTYQPHLNAVVATAALPQYPRSRLEKYTNSSAFRPVFQPFSREITPSHNYNDQQRSVEFHQRSSSSRDQSMELAMSRDHSLTMSRDPSLSLSSRDPSLTLSRDHSMTLASHDRSRDHSLIYDLESRSGSSASERYSSHQNRLSLGNFVIK